MKILLACLMCMLLNTVQCFAIDGGPWGPGGGITVTGNYAGVLVPIPTVLDPGPPPVLQTDNSLALYTMTIPRVGLASGTAAVFRNGIFYPGTISGLGDPDTAKVTGIINASFQETVAQTSTTDFIFTFSANGKFDTAKIVAGKSSSSVERMRGQASLTYVNDAGDPSADSGGPLLYRIVGFKQSEVSS